jgi:hypothetical protein
MFIQLTQASDGWDNILIPSFFIASVSCCLFSYCYSFVATLTSLVRCHIIMIQFNVDVLGWESVLSTHPAPPPSSHSLQPFFT